MMKLMKRSHITHYTFIEAAHAWQRPIGDVVQMAANGLFHAHVIVDGWAELDEKSLLKSLTSDSVKIEKVKYGGEWHRLKYPEHRYWKAVFVDGATLVRFGNQAS
jgi:hypothetical protein